MSSLPDLQAKIKLARSRFQARPDSRDFAPLADLLREAGQYREALLILDKGLRKFPRYVTGFVIKGRTLIEAEYGELGQDVLKKALTLDPQNILALDLLIGEAASRKAWKEVLGPLEKLVALEPEDEKLIVFLSKVRQKLMEQEDVPPVHQDYRTVVAEQVPEPQIEQVPDPEPEPKIEPAPVPVPQEIPKPIVPKAKVEPPAIKAVEPPVASALPGGDSHVTMTMVDIYLAQGYREMAITALEEILEANPGRDDVLEKLANLRNDPNCGVPASRKETPAPAARPSSNQTLAEQRRKDKDQFTRWIEGVNDNFDGDNIGEDNIDGGKL